MENSFIKKSKRIAFSFLIAGASLSLIACSTEDASKGQKENQSEERQGQQGEDVASATELTLENDGVDEKELASALEQFPEGVAEQLVTTSVPLTEMLSVLEITPVGVPTSTNPIPAAFDEVQRIGSPMAPDLEVLTKLKPDLVIGAESLRSSLEESIKGIDVKTAYLPTDSFDDLKLSFKALGTYFEQTEKMNEKMQEILNKENELVQKAAGKDMPKVLLMIGTADSFMVMNENSYLGSLVERLGADNIATSILKAQDTYSPMNMEEIVVANPDIVFVLASGDHGASEKMLEDEMNGNEMWSKLAASQNDAIHILDSEIFGMASIENVEKALTEIGNYFFE
mgnify:CR=1 FL=1